MDKSIRKSNGRIIPHRNEYDRESCEKRRKWLEGKLGHSLSHLGVWWSSEGEEVREGGLKYSVENPIGFAMVPIGLAGPLLIQGAHAQGEFYAPIASVEGSLVASTSRGAKVVTESGGVRAYAGKQRMARAPLFVTSSPRAAELLAEWIQTARERMVPIIRSVSRHSQLKEIHFMQDFQDLHVYFAYETGDAAGQNMTTLVTDTLTKWIQKTAPGEITEERIEILHAFTEGGFTGDKNEGSTNHLYGRGLSCFASADIPERLLKEHMKVSSQLLIRHWNSGRRLRQTINTHGSSLHIPNVMAGLFIATGQDAGCVPEASVGQTDIQPLPNRDGIRITVNLPCLVIGTIGGATTLPTQRNCLEILGCVGAGRVRKLGEIIAGFVLCSELSLSAALASGSFAEAMRRFNHPSKKKSQL